MEKKKDFWLDKPGNVNLLIKTVFVICAGLLVADLFYDKHPITEIGGVKPEYLFGFYGFYGFICFCGIVFAGKYLRKLIMRDEGFYDKDSDGKDISHD